MLDPVPSLKHASADPALRAAVGSPSRRYSSVWPMTQCALLTTVSQLGTASVRSIVRPLAPAGVGTAQTHHKPSDSSRFLPQGVNVVTYYQVKEQITVYQSSFYLMMLFQPIGKHFGLRYMP